MRIRIAAMVLGLVGGVLGLLISTVAGAAASVFGQSGAGLLVIACAIVGLVGGALTLAMPRLAATLMIIAALAGLVFVHAFYIVPAPLLFIGAILACVDTERDPASVTTTTAPIAHSVEE